MNLDTIKTELKEYILDNINYYDKEIITDYYNLEGDTLYEELFNRDYYIIGTYKCKEWLKEHNLCTFEVCEYIKEYEVEMFGKCTTDFSSPEKVVNMLVYILGSGVLCSMEDEIRHKYDIFTIGQIYSKESIDKDVKWVVNEVLNQGKEKIEYNKLLEGKEKEEYIKKHFKQK